ncbi:MAG: hypothetical protein HY236_18065 [Acidobacteria bacterium]|nr:hypothetical protein [Acidobacteriota bacterium]
MRWLLRGAVVLLAIYLVLVGVVVGAMYQPPDRFTRVMSKVPFPVMAVMPFERFWTRARAGHLQPGDAAPDFELFTADKSSTVRLSSFRGQKPVVLVFGSYT